jgi:protease-4
MRRFGRIILYIFASIGAIVALSLTALIIIAVRYDAPESELPDRIVLRLNLDKGITDGRSDDPWRVLRGDKAVYLHDIIGTLKAAQKDERVAGLLLRLGAARIGVAHAQELRGAISAFRKNGKFVTAFAETFGGLGNATSEYYLASSADTVWMQPSGMLGLIGIGLETPFLKDAFDKAGIKPEFEQRHEYKSAVEIFTRSDMSASSRQSLTRMIEGWVEQIAGGIAADRSISKQDLRALIDRSPLLAEEAHAAKLIDRLGYWDAVVNDTNKRGGSGSVILALSRYSVALPEPEEPGTNVALIYGVGPIETGDSEASPFDSERFAAGSVAKAINAAADDDTIKAIIFRVDSPGGSYIASDTVRRAVKRARDMGKPVIASMGKYGASGGYFVSMGADKIVALPATVTGSIGVFGGKVSTAALWNKLGINWARIGVGANAGMWSQIYPFSASAAARHAAVLDFIYRDFTEKVAADRALPQEALDDVARGRIWTGTDAMRVGLVDALGGYTVTENLVREALSLPEDAPLHIVVMPKPVSPFDRIRNALAEGAPFTVAIRAAIAPPAHKPLDTILQTLEPVIGDARMLRPPAGVLQLPPFRIVQ